MSGAPPPPDLVDCADEPIRVPGAVQPHGVLLALDPEDLTVRVASANATGLFGRPVQAVPVGALLAPDEAERVTAALRGDLAELDPLRVLVAGTEVDLVAHRSDGLLVTEWEPLAGANEAGGAWHRRLPRVLQRLSGAASLAELTEALAVEVRTLTGFDRVMVYRFDPEWNGEVVAEACEESLEPLLGLRYPATDIPAQARALYVENWLRLIPDARYAPVPLDTVGAPLPGPLDLTGALLRSVSPVHLEYLANMGVVSSMSVSLVDRGRLWGLVACHHYAGAHRPSYADRVAAEFLGRSASLLLATKTDQEDSDRVLQVADRLSRLLGGLARAPRRALDALCDEELTLLDLLPADGAAVRLDGRLRLLGRTPGAEEVARLVEQLPEGPTATSHLSSLLPAARDLVDTASGLLLAPVASGGGDFLAWFRGETLREVSWGGDPGTTKIVADERGLRLSPRQSFARWTETVRETSAPWAGHEVAAAERLAAYLADVALRRAQEDGRLATALQRTLLLESLPEIPGVALAAHYAPSASDVVGGDWYDLVPLPSGRLCVVLGDVAGHGLGAAAVTAQLRHGLRAMLLQDAGPARALQRLNELVGLLLPGEMATAVIAELDPATGAVALSSAGHLPVLHLSPGSSRLIGERQGPALGLLDSASYAQLAVQLGPADRLLLYSDGLVERRTADLDERLQQLRASARLGDGDASALVSRVVSALAPTGADDVTVLALGLA